MDTKIGLKKNSKSASSASISDFKIKALNLVDKHYLGISGIENGKIHYDWRKKHFGDEKETDYGIAIKHSLITVSEILHQVAGTEKKNEGSNYWSFVKEELKKL